MRSLKKLLAVLLALTIVFSVMVVPTFAQSLRYEEEARRLYDLGLFKGRSDKEYVPDLESRLTREEGIAILLRIFCLDKEAEKLSEQEAKDILSQFSDADKVSGWALKYVAYAVKEGIVAGRTGGVLSPLDPLLGKEYATMLLRLLGYTVDASNYEFATADFATTTGFPNAEAIRVNNEFITRDDVVGMSYYTVGSNYKDGSSVIGKIIEANPSIKAKAIEFGLLAIADVVDEIEPITIKVGETYQLPATVKVKYTDGSEADVAVTWDRSAVKTDVAGEYKAYGTVAGLDEKIEVTIIVEPDVLAVESVTADNLKEVVVVYNQEVDENAEVAKKDNYTLNTDKIASVKVDGNTVILTLDGHADNQEKAKLTISDKILPEKQEFEFTFFDATLPEVLGVEATGPKSIKIIFSEPMNEPGKITLKKGSSTLSVSTNYTTDGKATVNVPLYSSFVDGETYEITIKDFKDFAGYANVIKTIEFKYEKDETPPVATVAEATQKYVKLTFNKPVKGLTNEHFSHTFTAWTAIKLTSDDKYTSDQIDKSQSVSEVYVWFYNDGSQKDIERPIPEGETTFRIRNKDSAGNEIKDEWGNKLEEVEVIISVTADKTPPEVTALEVKAEDALTIKFSENVKFSKDNVEILDAEGKKIDGVKVNVPEASGGKEYTIQLGKKLAGKTILVNITKVEDTSLNANRMADYSTTIEITDKTEPEINKVTYAKENDKYYLYVFYNEDVEEESALKISNYYIYKNGQYTKLTKSATFFSGEKIVKIELTDAQFETISSIAGDITKGGIFVTGVKDIAGNEIIPTVFEVAGEQSEVNYPKFDKVTATAVDKIEVVFDQQLAKVDPSAFKVYNGSKEYKIIGMDDLIESGKTKVILTLDPETKLPYDVSGVKIKVENKDKIENLFGSTIPKEEEVVADVIDKIAPALKKIEQPAMNEIKLIFEENIMIVDGLTKEYAAADIVITNKDDDKVLAAGKDFEIIEFKDNYIIIKLKADATDKNFNIARSGDAKYFVDGSNNKLASFDKDIKVNDALPKINVSNLKNNYTAVNVDPDSITDLDSIVEELKLTPVKVTLKNSTGLVYEGVRVVVDVKDANNKDAIDKVSFWAKDTTETWYNIVEKGWGPENGFVVDKDYDKTTDVYVMSNTPGKYTITIKLVYAENPNRVVAKYTGTLNVVDPQQQNN